MFGPKKQRVSKKDIKKSIVNANDRLRAANLRMETDIDAKKNALQLLSDEYISSKEALEDVQGLQAYANNELEALQSEIFQIQNDKKKASSEIAELHEESVSLEQSNKKLEDKKDKIFKFITSLEDKKEKLKNVSSELKAIKKEEAEGQETLSLLAEELNELEAGVESYISRKSAAESEFSTFKAKIDRDKRIAEKELKEIEDCGKKVNFKNGQEMGRLDHAIAARFSELKTLDEDIARKKYEYSAMEGLIKTAQTKADDADEHATYAMKKEQDKVDKIKQDFKEWKVNVLDEVARMKLRKKMDNIDKAGLRKVLDG